MNHLRRYINLLPTVRHIRWVFRYALAGFFLVLFSACSETPIKGGEQKASASSPRVSQHSERVQAPYLKHSYAALRAQQVSNVDYRLSVVLDEKSDRFSGEVDIQFDFNEGNDSPLTIDFNGGDVEAMSFNGKPVEWQYEGFFITLAAKDLSAGRNSLVVKYTHPYSTNGEGLHRFQDPETKSVYLYTNFEPYDANKLFPHFDQPDIKASYTVDVIAPAAWHVISATSETSIKPVGESRHWVFPKSARISSYIFPLHAGPFKVWQRDYKDKHGTIPMRLFARDEVAEYVVIEDWFTFTTQSFTFFNEYFEYPYPFLKYDQIIVPDFNAGAMENLAAVTFNEGFVSRGEKSEAQRIRLANVIAHEMAHMWFGNLVTMSWWNGLWLNESFATYMANLQLTKTSDFKNTWDTFYSGTKQWAYRTDQLVTTHAIELPVPTTADAFTNFDGITYGKGASVLKQLPYYLGEENFRQGVANYLRKHAYANTELVDFTGALGKAAGKDLEGWTHEWLYQAGLNSLETVFECSDGKLAQLRLLQTAPDSLATLRAQRVQLGLFSLDPKGSGPAKKLAAIPVTYSGAVTEVSVPENVPCPNLIYPNFDDWGYIKPVLDTKSQVSLASGINRFEDDGLRIMLWQSQWDKVRDTLLPLHDFVNFAVENIVGETNDRIVSQVAKQLVRSSRYYWLNDPEGNRFAAQRKAITQLMWSQLKAAPGGSDLQKAWYGYWARSASEEQSLKQAEQLLSGKLVLEGLTLDQDKRWRLVRVLNRYQYPGSEKLAAAESERDKSERGQLMALSIEATRPDSGIKKKWLGVIAGEQQQYKLAQLTVVMRSLFPSSQMKIMEEFSAQLMDELPELLEEKDDLFISRFTNALLPASCSTESVARLEKAIKQYDGKNPTLDKTLRITHQEDARCVAIGKML